MKWYDKCFRQGFKNLGGDPQLGDFSARKLAKYWKGQGAELVYMDVIHQTSALCPTEKTVHEPFLQGRDLVAEFVEACAEYDIRPGAYVTPLEHSAFLCEHPEWSQTETNGELVMPPPKYVKAGLRGYWGCWNSPMVDNMAALIAEIFQRYPLQACFFDGLLGRHSVCHCPACTKKFKARTGLELPGSHDRKDPAFRAFVKFRDETMTEAAQKLVAAAKSANADVYVTANTPEAWCGWCDVQPESVLATMDASCVEAHAGFNDLSWPGYIHASSVATTAFLIKYTRGQTPGATVVQAYNAAGDYPCGITANIDVDLDLEMKSAIALGAAPCLQFDQPIIKEHFDYIERCEPYLIGAKPLKWAGVVASQASCDAQYNDDWLHYYEDVKGMFQALFDLQVPVDFVSGHDLRENRIDDFAVLVLSDIGYLDERQEAVVRDFVAKGGFLLATHASGMIGEDGEALANGQLADVLGVTPLVAETGKASKAVSLWFKDDPPWWGDDVVPWFRSEAGSVTSPGHPWLNRSDAHPVPVSWRKVAPGAATTIHAWMQEGTFDSEPEYPAIVEHGFGRGKTIYLAPKFGAMYARTPLPLWRKIMQEALARYAPPPPVTIDAPLCVSVHPWRLADGPWVVHLINDLDESGRNRGRIHMDAAVAGVIPRSRTIPIADVTVTVRHKDIAKAELPLSNRKLNWRKTADGAVITVERLVRHAMIVMT